MTTRRSFLAATLGVGASVIAAPAASTRPNILLVLMDDLGYSSLSCYGNKLVPTPNLDRLAAEGIRFTDAYVTPQCTPTRATLLTGQYTAVNRMWHVIPPYQYPKALMAEPACGEGLTRDAFTLAKGMKRAGYATACIGKWHLTTNGDGNYGGLNPAAAHFYGFDTVATPAKSANEFGTGDKAVDRFTDEAIAFVRSNRAKPWFCYLAHHSIHGPVSAPASLVKKYRDKGFPEVGLNNATYLAAIEHFDAAVGRLVKAVDEIKLGSSTLVIFLSDNGGVYRSWKPNPPAVAPGEPLRLQEGRVEMSNEPLRAGKGSAYEGGIRVPMIARWTGTVRAGQTCATPVHIVDLMPTFFELAHVHAPAGYRPDGVSMAPLLEGKKLPNRALYWYQPFYDIRWLATPSAVIREGDDKLIEFFGDYFEEGKDYAEYKPGGRVELYNLRQDIGETRDLAAKMPDKAEALRRKLHAWIRSTGSPIPAKNPRYDRLQPFIEARGQPTAR